VYLGGGAIFRIRFSLLFTTNYATNLDTIGQIL
jgi:hypothetical protein